MNNAFYVAAQAGCVPCAEGPPGCAKTASILAFGHAIRRPVYVLLGSIRESADICGYPCLKDGVMSIAPPDWAVAINKEPSILVFDELTTCAPDRQASMLRVMNERWVADLKLRDETYIMALCNPMGQAANGQELEPAMANRIVHLHWEIDWSIWEQGLVNGLKFDDPTFPVVPENWRDQIAPIASMVAAFRRHMPAHFANYPENERSKACGAWPSQRSWTNGILCMAAARAAGCDMAVESELLSGCIGDGTEIMYREWLSKLDLPAPAEVMEWSKNNLKGKHTIWPSKEAKKEGKKDYCHPDRADKAIAMLSGVTSIALQTADPKDWEGAINVCKQAAQYQLDVSVMCMVPLAKKIPQGATWDAQFFAQVGVMMQEVCLPKK